MKSLQPTFKLIITAILLITFSCDTKISREKQIQEQEIEKEIVKEIEKSEVEGTFVHAVYFWLKDADSEEARNYFLTGLRNFIDQSPNILVQHIGEPADTNRDIIDSTYTYSLILTFEDKAAHDRYQEEEAHQVFRDHISDTLEKIVIYDSELKL